MLSSAHPAFRLELIAPRCSRNWLGSEASTRVLGNPTAGASWYRSGKQPVEQVCSSREREGPCYHVRPVSCVFPADDPCHASCCFPDAERSTDCEPVLTLHNEPSIVAVCPQPDYLQRFSDIR